MVDTNMRISIWRKPVDISIVVAVIVLMLLNLFDVFATLYGLTCLGAREGNPVMAKLLAQGPVSFFVVKYLGIAICAIIIVICCHKKRAFRWVLFGLVLPLYFVLFAYWLYFLSTN